MNTRYKQYTHDKNRALNIRKGEKENVCRWRMLECFIRGCLQGMGDAPKRGSATSQNEVQRRPRTRLNDAPKRGPTTPKNDVQRRPRTRFSDVPERGSTTFQNEAQRRPRTRLNDVPERGSTTSKNEGNVATAYSIPRGRF